MKDNYATNTGDLIRNWINSSWKPDDDFAVQIIDEEWENAVKDLKGNTFKGHIRYDVLNLKQLVHKIQRRIHWKKSEEFIINMLRKKFSEPSFYKSVSFFSFPRYSYEERKVNEAQAGYCDYNPYVIYFYGNEVESSNLETAKNLLSFWFEDQCLKDYAASIMKARKDKYYRDPFVVRYNAGGIMEPLKEKWKVNLTLEDVTAIFSKLCDYHGMKLVDVSFDDYYYWTSIKISL